MSPTNAPNPTDHAAAPPPLVVISLGDPAGIGSEITVKCLADKALRTQFRCLLLGNLASLHQAASKAEITPYWVELSAPALPASGEHLSIQPSSASAAGSVWVVDIPRLSPVAGNWSPTDSAEGGRISFNAVEHAIQLAKRPPGDPWSAEAIVTAPISKTSWDLARREANPSDSARFGPAGKGFPGHTELLASRFGADRSAMLFVGPSMRVILVTIHIPLSRVAATVTAPRILETIELADRACRELGVESPRLAVCGLNPHAGEGGLLGDEDALTIAPAVRAAQAKGIDVRGPLPADTVFGKALLSNGRRRDDSHGFDCIVAMYHDQGLIPVKLTDALSTVNVTVGLSWNGRRIIRTSPAHGTAFDIAGQNLADPSSMRSAITLALEMIDRRRRQSRHNVQNQP